MNSVSRKYNYIIRYGFFGTMKVTFTGGPTYRAQVEELREASKVYAHLVGRYEILTGAQWCQRIIDNVAPSEQRRKSLRAIKSLMCVTDRRPAK